MKALKWRWEHTQNFDQQHGWSSRRAHDEPDGRGRRRCCDLSSRDASHFCYLPAIVAAGGRIANVGVHGKLVELHMEKLWDRNISITTRLVDTVTTPMLLKVGRSGKLQPNKLAIHHFAMSDIMQVYETFGNAAKEGAVKVILTNAALRG